jgi:hypothetical protein
MDVQSPVWSRVLVVGEKWKVVMMRSGVCSIYLLFLIGAEQHVGVIHQRVQAYLLALTRLSEGKRSCRSTGDARNDVAAVLGGLLLADCSQGRMAIPDPSQSFNVG